MLFYLIILYTRHCTCCGLSIRMAIPVLCKAMYILLRISIFAVSSLVYQSSDQLILKLHINYFVN